MGALKKYILFFSLFLSTATTCADTPCTEQSVTKEIFTKKYAHNVIIKKRSVDNGCGIKETRIEIFQGNQKIETLRSSYDVALRSDDQTDKQGNKQVVFTAYSGGHGTNLHYFGAIEADMKKMSAISGYDIDLKDINKDGKKEIILPISIFFCISEDFCSTATGLFIPLILKFEDQTLVIDKHIMKQKNNLLGLCTTKVAIKSKKLTFSNKECAKKNLEILAYTLYSGETNKLKDILKYFNFDTQEAKDEFITKLLHEVENTNLISSDLI